MKGPRLYARYEPEFGPPAILVGDPPGGPVSPFPVVLDFCPVVDFMPTADNIRELAHHVEKIWALNSRRRLAVRWPVLS